MKWSDRLLMIMKVFFHDLLGRVENKKQLLSHYIREMSDEIQRNRHQLSDLDKEKAEKIRQLKQTQLEIRKNNADLEHALLKKREELAGMLRANQAFCYEHKKDLERKIHSMSDLIMHKSDQITYRTTLLNGIKIRCRKDCPVSDCRDLFIMM